MNGFSGWASGDADGGDGGVRRPEARRLACLPTRPMRRRGGTAGGGSRPRCIRRADGTLERVEAQGNVTMQAKGATVVSQKADVALNASRSGGVGALLRGRGEGTAADKTAAADEGRVGCGDDRVR